MPDGHNHFTSEDPCVSLTIIEAVANRSGKEPETLPPLYETIDTEALDTLFEPMGPDAPRSGGTVEFRYAGYLVRVSVDRTVEVTVSSTSD